MCKTGRFFGSLWIASTCLYANPALTQSQPIEAYLNLSTAEKQLKIEQVLSQPLTDKTILVINLSFG